MSFKRDGDDLCLLNKLKNKRVSDILESHIPEDEAKLLSNGRLTCLICPSRPIFDTMAMLAHHRHGKKHLFSLSKHLKKLEDIEFEITKRRQMLSLKKDDIESRLRSKILGAECSETFSTPDRRKKVLEIPKLNAYNEPSLLIKSAEKSANSQLRKYLKSIHRKPSLDKVLEKRKESYSCVEKIENSIQIKEAKHKKIKTHISQESMDKSKMEFSKNLSGYIKNLDGTWTKDPKAEFDSDEE